MELGLFGKLESKPENSVRLDQAGLCVMQCFLNINYNGFHKKFEKNLILVFFYLLIFWRNFNGMSRQKLEIVIYWS